MPFPFLSRPFLIPRFSSHMSPVSKKVSPTATAAISDPRLTAKTIGRQTTTVQSQQQQALQRKQGYCLGVDGCGLIFHRR